MPKLKITEPGKKAKSYTIKITRKSISLGRRESNDIMLTDPSVSSKHCEIRRVEGGYILDDLESTNGSKIDGQRYLKIDLDADTKLKLGDVFVDFSFTDEECDTLDAEESFSSEEKKKPKKNKNSRPSSKQSNDEDELAADDEDETSAGTMTFLITVISFIVTITVALAVLYFTGHLSF